MTTQNVDLIDYSEINAPDAGGRSVLILQIGLDSTTTASTENGGLFVYVFENVDFEINVLLR